MSSNSDVISLPSSMNVSRNSIPSQRPPKQKCGGLKTFLLGTVGTVCAVAAAFFALFGLLIVAAAIFTAASGGGSGSIVIGVLSAAIFTGLTVASVALSIHFFRKITP